MLCFRCGSHNPDGSEFCSQCGQKFLDRKKAAKDPTDPETKAIGADEAQTLVEGEQIAERYEVRAVVGAGPVGTVYRAHDLEIDVDVAVKVLSPKLLQSRDERRRFLAEIRNARKIKHPNVVRLYDEDQDDDLVYFTMQMLEGLSLRKIIQLRKDKKQTFQPKELEPIFSHICQALDLAHETTAHGDLKPENIIVLPDMLKVTDFGLLQSLPHRPFVAAQRAGFAGAAYLAPEVREDTPKLEPPADIYSLGVILCEMVSREIYEGPASALPSLPDEFDKLAPVIKRALNENPDKRHRSPREFFEELHGVTSGKPARPPRPAPRRAEASGKQEAEPAKASKPPRAAPSRKKVSFGVGDAVDPPTVVDASVQGDEAPVKQGKLAKKTDEDEAIGDLAGDLDADEIEEISEDEIEDIDAAGQEELLEDEAFEPDDEADEDEPVDVDDDLIEEEIDESIDTTPEDDQETLVATPLTPVADADVRVARPKDSSPPPEDTDDVGAQLGDQPEQVELLKARKRQNTQPVQSPIDPNEPAVEVAPQTPVPRAAAPVAQASVPPPNYSYPPGTYSQPPYPYSQPPPAPSRVPVYIFLGVITAIVGTGVFFLVDYLIAAKQQLSGAPAAVVAGPTVDGGAPAAGVDQAAAAKLAAEQKKLEAERKRVEEYLKAEEARLAEQRKKLQEDAKEDEKRLAAMAPKPEESKSAFEARKAEERRKAEQRKKAEEARLAEKRRKAEQRRKAEEARLAEKRRKAEQRRKAEEARLAEKRRKAEQRRLAMQRRKDDAASRAAKAKDAEAARKAEEKRLAEERAKAASNRPMLEEVPIPGDDPKPALPAPRPGPAGEPLKPEPAPKEVAKVVEPPKEPAKAPAGGSCPRGMSYVSDGTAYIGSATNDPMRNFGELKLHKVQMKGYCIDRYEYPNVSGQKPRTGVSWKSAERLCRKRGKRLCTEEEWEYACKGKGNRSFPYGNKWDAERCNTEDGAGTDREIGAAGAFARCRSPFGVRDMSGNVSEWTASKYKSGAGARTYKGGSATRPNWATRCATRSSLSPGAKKSDLGFRCCANAK